MKSKNTLKRDSNCTLCSLSKNVPQEQICILGTGSIPNDVMIIGSSKEEDEKNWSLIKRYLIKKIGGVFIAPAIACPTEKRPTKSQIASCKKWVDYQIQKVKPQFILVLGNTPLQSLTGESGIARKRGKVFMYRGITCLSTYHPSYVKERPSVIPVFKQDLRSFYNLVMGKSDIKGLNYREITENNLGEVLESLTGYVALDLETTGLYPWHPGSEINSLAIAVKDKQWYIIKPRNNQLLRSVIKKIKKDCHVIGQNGKFDQMWLSVNLNKKITFEEDTQLMAHLIDENNSTKLKILSQRYLGLMDYDISLEDKTNPKNFDLLVKYNSSDSLCTLKLFNLFKKSLREDKKLNNYYNKVSRKLPPIYADIQENGVYVNMTRFKEVESHLISEIKKAQNELDQYASNINWSSADQLSDLFFNKWGLDVIDLTPKGKPSVSESVLLRLDHDCTKVLLKYRGLKQQHSFFIEGWKKFLVKDKDGYYLHPSFKLTGTVTGRLSCSDPNLQQVTRDPLIRSMITAPPGEVFIEADYSQVELRIAAELAFEEVMLKAFQNNEDPHWLTALKEIEKGGGGSNLVTILKTAEIHTGVKNLGFKDSISIIREIGFSEAERIQKDIIKETNPERMWKEVRKKAKAINFGFLYGMWPKKFIDYARDNFGIKMTLSEAKKSRDNFFTTYPGLQQWHQRQINFARRNGFVRSLSGRVRHLPAAQRVTGSYDYEKSEAERQAINSPVQSFANDLALMSLIEAHKKLDRSQIKFTGTVHDSIHARIKEGKVDSVCEDLKEIMISPEIVESMGIKLRVPIEVDISIGDWGNGKKWGN